jgi:hypothetical protein
MVRLLWSIGEVLRCNERVVGTAGKSRGSALTPSEATKLFRRMHQLMSLYYEAAAILANADKVGGSLKSRIFSKKDLKSTPGQLFALIAESSKWSVVLKDVMEKTKLLAEERKVSLLRDTPFFSTAAHVF